MSLNDRHRMILAALVYGFDGAMAAKHNVTPNKALNQHQVADIHKLRRAYVRWLMADPLFRSEFNQALAIRRQAYVPHAIDRIGELIDSNNQTIALRASESMIGDVKPGLSVNVAVQTNLGGPATPRAGYVIRLDRPRAAQTIDQDTKGVAPPFPEDAP
jgi:hypothetical protein